MKILKKLFYKKQNEEVSITQKETQPSKIMRDIYLNKRWGGKKYDFYSGFGSHSKKVVKPYVRVVRGFLDSHQNKLVVCDIGCGDFNVGSQLVAHAKAYFAVDVVEELIIRNKELFKDDKLTFDCVDIINEQLPIGDCVLIRQVLQHLSNDDIKKIIPKLQKFKYAIVTEHLPKKEFIANKDKTTGVNIRLSRGSGIVLHQEPFNLKAKRTTEILRKHYNKGVITTMLYEF